MLYHILKSHHLVLKENKPISRDSDLEAEQIPSTDEVNTAHDIIKTVVRVGHILHKKQAILLPSVHNIYVSHARDLLKAWRVVVQSITTKLDIQVLYGKYYLCNKSLHHATENDA